MQSDWGQNPRKYLSQKGRERWGVLMDDGSEDSEENETRVISQESGGEENFKEIVKNLFKA